MDRAKQALFQSCRLVDDIFRRVDLTEDEQALICRVMTAAAFWYLVEDSGGLDAPVANLSKTAAEPKSLAAGFSRVPEVVTAISRGEYADGTIGHWLQQTLDRDARPASNVIDLTRRRRAVTGPADEEPGGEATDAAAVASEPRTKCAIVALAGAGTRRGPSRRPPRRSPLTPPA